MLSAHAAGVRREDVILTKAAGAAAHVGSTVHDHKTPKGSEGGLMEALR